MVELDFVVVGALVVEVEALVVVGAAVVEEAVEDEPEQKLAPPLAAMVASIHFL